MASMGTPLRTSKWRCILAARCWSSIHKAQTIFGRALRTVPSTAQRFLRASAFTTLIQRQSPTSDFLKDGPQVLGGKDFGSFAQRSQRSGANAQKTLHFFQLGGTLQRPHAFDNRIEKIQQQQGGVLVEEQFAIPRFVARSPHRLESFQERKQHVEIFEAFEIGLANLGLTRTGQQSTLGMQLPAWQQPGRLRPIPDTPARFVPNARKIVEK